MTSVESIVERLALERHPEGGWYSETWRGADGPGGRPVGTSILYLLGEGEVSAWHRIDADEVWFHHTGAALALSVSLDGRGLRTTLLGPDLDAGHVPQAVVPAGAWQSARPTGRWSLVGCSVAPGFIYDGFELAPPGWVPGSR